LECDILIICGGVLGFISAYHMKRRKPDNRIVLIDRLGGPGQGNSAKSREPSGTSSPRRPTTF